MLVKRITMMLVSCAVMASASELRIPNFLDPAEINGATFECVGKEAPKFNAEDQKNIDILWGEALTYLKGVALGMTNSGGSHCMNSAEAITDTTAILGGKQKICVTDGEDIQQMVKNIYQVLANPDKAKKCFTARRNVKWLYNPGRELSANSPVAKWANRMTFDEFFDKKVKNKEVRKRGHVFTKNFYKMVTNGIQTPSAIPFDITAKALPNLWAAGGWFPMYAQNSKRNEKNFMNVRGGYAYAEIMGHWGLLRIKKINGEPVGAEIGMTVQSGDTFYPYHYHAMPEFYWNLRPSCNAEFKNFIVREDSPYVKTVYEDDKVRRVQFDASASAEPRMWVGSEELVYLPANSIHAFHATKCGDTTVDAWTSIWGRTNAHDERNDYGTTHLCESAAHPGTPAHRGEMIQCDLSHIKWVK